MQVNFTHKREATVDSF